MCVRVGVCLLWSSECHTGGPGGARRASTLCSHLARSYAQCIDVRRVHSHALPRLLLALTASCSLPPPSMRLFQLLASPPTSFSRAFIPNALPPPSAPPDDTSASSPPSAVTVPFFSVGGFVECPWYRRALCIADEFVRTQVERTERATFDAAATEQPSLPQHTRIQSVTLPRQQYRQYLLSLKQHLDLHDHYSCPIILRGTCTVTGTAQQHEVDYPLQHTSVSGGVTSSAVECECKADTLVGGYSEFERLLEEQYGFVATRCGRLAPGSPGGQC